MALSTYLPPVSGLLICGECQAQQVLINYVQEFGFGREHIPDLIRMATDKKLYSSRPESIDQWAPLASLKFKMTNSKFKM